MVEIEGPRDPLEDEDVTYRAVDLEEGTVNVRWFLDGTFQNIINPLNLTFFVPGERRLRVETEGVGGILGEAEIIVDVQPRDEEEPPVGGEPPGPVEPPPLEPPLEVSEGLTFTLPFSVLNFAPWVSGVEDVELTIPQASDVRQAVRETAGETAQIASQTVFNLLGSTVTEDGRTVQDAFQEILDTAFAEADDILDDVEIQAAVTAAVATDDLPDFGAIVDDVREELRDLEDSVTEAVDAAVDGVREDIDDLRTDGVPDLGAVVDETVQAVQDGFDGVVDDVTDALSETEDALGSALGTAVDTGFAEGSSLFDGLDRVRGDVEGVIQDVNRVGSDVGAVLSRLPEDFETGVGEAVRAAEPTVDDAGLFTDPVQFTVNVLDDASDDLSDEAAQSLQQAQEATDRWTVQEDT